MPVKNTDGIFYVIRLLVYVGINAKHTAVLKHRLPIGVDGAL